MAATSALAAYTILMRDPWGKRRSKRGNMTQLSTSYLFTNQRWDKRLGLYDYNARYYDAGLGRFISSDSIIPDEANPNAFNRFAYNYNNPINYTDPDGHTPQWFDNARNWVSDHQQEIIIIVSAILVTAVLVGVVAGTGGLGAMAIGSTGGLGAMAIGSVVGATMDLGFQVATEYGEDGNIDLRNDIDLASIAVSGVVGGVSAGAGGIISKTIATRTASAAIGRIGANAAASAAIGGSGEAMLQDFRDEPRDWSAVGTTALWSGGLGGAASALDEVAQAAAQQIRNIRAERVHNNTSFFQRRMAEHVYNNRVYDPPSHTGVLEGMATVGGFILGNSTPAIPYLEQTQNAQEQQGHNGGSGSRIR